MISALETYILKNVSANPNDIERFVQLFTRRKVAKKEFLLRNGEVCDFEGFVTKGLFKVFHLDLRGNEQILYFATEHWWISDIDSFTNQQVSQLYIQALEEGEIWVINYKDKNWAYQHIPFVEQLFRIMTQKTHVALQRRMIANLSKTADERYLDFIDTYPQTAQRITNIQMAGYLGVSPEFVSKIRRKLTLKK